MRRGETSLVWGRTTMLRCRALCEVPSPVLARVAGDTAIADRELSANAVALLEEADLTDHVQGLLQTHDEGAREVARLGGGRLGVAQEVDVTGPEQVHERQVIAEGESVTDVGHLDTNRDACRVRLFLRHLQVGDPRLIEHESVFEGDSRRSAPVVVPADFLPFHLTILLVLVCCSMTLRLRRLYRIARFVHPVGP